MLRSTKKTSVEITLVFCFTRSLKSHPRGWIRTAAALSQKTAQKQPRGLFLAARLAQSTRAHQELQYPNRVLEFLFCRNISRGPQRVDSNSIDPPNSPAGKKAPVQQRRPLPAAETGRSCWGCGQQGARAAQGTMQPLGAATRTHCSARLAQSTRAHQEIQYPNRVLDFLFYRNFFRAGREEGKCENQSPVLAQARRVC